MALRLWETARLGTCVAVMGGTQKDGVWLSHKDWRTDTRHTCSEKKPTRRTSVRIHVDEMPPRQTHSDRKQPTRLPGARRENGE